MQVDVRQLVLAIARATDLVGIDDLLHGETAADTVTLGAYDVCILSRPR